MSKPAAAGSRPAVHLVENATGPRPPAPESTPQSGSVPQADGSAAAAVALLQLQAEMRKAKTLLELGYFIANEARPALRAQQVIVLRPTTRRSLRVQTVSSLTTVDHSSPLIVWLESAVRKLRSSHGLAKPCEFLAEAYAAGFEQVQGSYPLRHMLWVPWLVGEATGGGGMLLARSTPWTENDIRIATYLAGAFGHAWRALARPRSHGVLALLTSYWTIGIIALAGAALMALPVPMTALAPVEVAPKDTVVVTSGVPGIVKGVVVDPNAVVAAGQVLVRLDDTELRNRAEIAERDALVADSTYKKAAQLAFVDARGRHDMAIAKAELDLKLAERDYARDLLARTEIKAERAGVAFFADKSDLVGKPVAVGEKLMELADPAASEFRIDLPVGDSIVLHDGARVKVFLDSDPLHPIDAHLIRAAYKAAPREAQQLAFRLVAAGDASQPAKLRLGMRGTAQIYSDPVPLGFFLFRRPIAALRQWSGL